MTFAETLENARNGERAAYDLLCNAAVNELYAAAVLVLDKHDAEKAVNSAFDEAEKSISRIKTFEHFKAWLTRTLARGMIAKLKEYKAVGFSPAGEGAVAAALALPDIERLVFALSAAGGFKTHEISVILGVPEDSIPARIASAERHLGENAENVRAFAVTCKAPARLRRTIEVPYSPGDTQTMEIAVKNYREQPEYEEEEPPRPESRLNAQTFIAVISKEHIKGSEFLRLLGNTRISNSAYREIEQNPELTKARLIELLEESQLDENDYYKLLSAVKQRREMIEAKEESRAQLEKAGLFDGHRYQHERVMPRNQKSDLARELELSADNSRQSEEAKRAEEARRLEEERRAEEIRRADEEARRLEEEARRLEEEAKRKAEEARRAAEEARRLEEERRADEEARKLEEERRAAEEARRLEEERRAAEEARRLEEERRAAEEARRLEEERRAAEEARRLEEERRAEEARRLEEERRAAEEARRLEEERRAEEARQRELEEKRRAMEEAKRLEEERLRAEEARRKLEEERRRAEEERRLAIEAKRRAEQEAREKKRIEDEKRLAEIEEQKRRLADEAKRIEKEQHAERQIMGTQEFDSTADRSEPEPEKPVGNDDKNSMKLSRKPEHQTQSLLFNTGDEKGGKDPADEKPFRPTVYDTYNIDKVQEDGGGFVLPNRRIEPKRPVQQKPAAPKSAPRPAPIKPIAQRTEPKPPVPETAPASELFTPPANDDFYEETPKKKFPLGKALIVIACVAAIAAIGAGVKLIVDKAALSTNVSEAVENVQTEPSTLSNEADVFRAISEKASRKTFFNPIYMRSDGTPYGDGVTADIKRVGGVMLLRGKNSIVKTELLRSGPSVSKLSISDIPENDLIGYASDSEHIYVIHKAGGFTAVRVYGQDMTLQNTYEQSGSFRAFSAENGYAALVTNYSPSSPDSNDCMSFMPVQSLNGDKKTIPCDSIELINDGAYNGFAVIGTLNENGDMTASAVLGCYDCFAKFENGGCTLLAVDKNRTTAIRYSGANGSYTVLQRRTFIGEAFSSDCLNGDTFAGFDTVDGTITVQKGESIVYCGIENELPAGVSFSDNGRVYVVTNADAGTTKLYGFDVSGSEILPDDGISSDRVYMDKLAACGDRLIGIRSEADSDGNVANLRLSLYSYGEKLTEDDFATISVDEKTSPQYAKYLSSSAEKDVSHIAVNDDGTRVAVAVRYFDGISDIMRIIILSVGDGALSEAGDLLLFDANSEYCCLSFASNALFIVTEDRVIVADENDCKPSGYFEIQ